MNKFELQTLQWIEEFVLKHDLCPFASEPYENKQLNFRISNDFCNENLSSNLFIIMPECNLSFMDFYSEVDRLEHDQFHFIAFHPQFCFEGLPLNSVANMVNQSPFPMIHVLARSEMEKARLSISQAESISIQNEKKLKKLFGSRR